MRDGRERVLHGVAIAVTQADGSARVRISGELDLASCSALGEHLDELLATNSLAQIDVDLSQLTFMDSTGLRTLWRARQAAIGRGAKLILRDPSHAVVRLLELTQLFDAFDVESGANGSSVPQRS